MNKADFRQMLADKLRHYRYRIVTNMYVDEAKAALTYLRSITNKDSFKKVKE